MMFEIPEQYKKSKLSTIKINKIIIKKYGNRRSNHKIINYFIYIKYRLRLWRNFEDIDLNIFQVNRFDSFGNYDLKTRCKVIKIFTILEFNFIIIRIYLCEWILFFISLILYFFCYRFFRRNHNLVYDIPNIVASIREYGILYIFHWCFSFM